MAQTVANLADVMKEVWSSDRLEKQFYDENPLLDRFERKKFPTIGKQVQVPIHKGRSGGYSVKSAAGGTLNAADEQKVDQALYTLSYHYQQVSIETGALNQADGGAHSIPDSTELEMTGAIADMRKQAMRQAVSNGDALIAQCTTTSNTTPVNLLSTGYGYDALVRGWLYPGLPVDVGTTANEVLRADGHFITAVSEVAATPTITLSTTDGGSAANLTTASTDFISIKDARSGTTSNEMNGLRQIFGSNSLGVGGLDPDNAGEEFWKPAEVVTASAGSAPYGSGATSVSLDLLRHLRMKIHQKTGSDKGTLIITSIKQYGAVESLLENQVRFTNPDSLSAGNATVKWGGNELLQVPDVPDRELYVVDPDSIKIATGSISKPTWMSDLEGSGGKLRWAQGATNFVDAVVYPFNLGITRRNGGGAAIGLTD